MYRHFLNAKELFLPIVFVLIINSTVFATVDNKVQSFIQKGNLAFKNYFFKTALENYKKASKLKPDNYRIICKLSKTYSEYGLSQKQEKSRLSCFIKAEELAKKAINLKKNQAEGYLCLAYAMGCISLSGNIKQKLKRASEIPGYANKALKLNPNLDLAWYILGSWHRRISGLSGFEKFLASITAKDLLKTASTEKAVMCLQKAINLNTHAMEYHLELGCAYEDLNMYDYAVSEYKNVLEHQSHCYKHKRYHLKSKEELTEIIGEGEN